MRVLTLLGLLLITGTCLSAKYRECIEPGDKGKDYLGHVSRTGRVWTSHYKDKTLECQRWDTTTPHHHTFTDSDFPGDGSKSAANNYCRNPDNEPRPWCYTTSEFKRWAFCDIPSCAECLYDDDPKGYQYVGTKSVTDSGYECQEWDNPKPYTMNIADKYFPDGDRKKAKNYCRNMFSSKHSPVCYVKNKWITDLQKCTIPKCV